MDRPPQLPEPTPPESKRWWRLAVVVLVLGVGIGLVGAYVTIPYYSLGPGPAKDVSQLVSVDGERTYPSSGVFFLTTVAVSSRPVTIFEALVGWVDPAVSVVEKNVIIQPGLTDQQQDQLNALDMEQSKYAAVIAALRAVGIDTPPIRGAFVIAVAQGFPAAGKLRAGDIVTAANGVAVRDPEALVNQITAKPIGTKHTLHVIRAKEEVTVELRTIASPTGDGTPPHPVIGAELGPAFRLPLSVNVDSQNIGGPSAGLAFALTIADALTEEDLTRGHRIAVTGTIGIDGTVGLVGGVEFKVRAAEREGADVFLVPKDEVAQASSVASDVEIIGVSTLEEAIIALRKLGRVVPAAA
ncbi:MAG: YlbL family protein [Actinomycetota bacterium]